MQVRVGLPEPPKGHKWCRVVDTNLASPKDFTPGGNAGGWTLGAAAAGCSGGSRGAVC